MHYPNNVNNRIERTNLMKMHFLDRHLMNCGLNFREPMKQADCSSFRLI